MGHRAICREAVTKSIIMCSLANTSSNLKQFSKSEITKFMVSTSISNYCEFQL